LRYAEIGTQSDRRFAAEKTPSTDTQWTLIRLLEQELKDLGVLDLEVTREGFVLARLPANTANPEAAARIGFMAHVDTASDVPGDNVRPQVHENYAGGPISLREGVVLNAETAPSLAAYVGDTIVTSDGTTLLGADDKAGVAALMSALEHLLAHPEISRPHLEFIFTPDEETGRGMDRFPLEKIRSKVAYTLDGDGEGAVEAECFNAYKVTVEFTGSAIHIGYGRGRLVNAISMAAHFLSSVPRTESPEATDGIYGYYCPLEISGDLASAHIEFFLRDFEITEIVRRVEALKAFGKSTEAAFPGGRVRVTEEKQYLNMRDSFREDARIVDFLDEAIRRTGREPHHASIRGGTDGARLSELGVPTPNLFAGGSNFHALTEWVPLSAMTRAAETVVNLAEIWAGAGAVP
jgi:tripeptide aminopeptidase